MIIEFRNSIVTFIFYNYNNINILYLLASVSSLLLKAYSLFNLYKAKYTRNLNLQIYD